MRNLMMISCAAMFCVTASAVSVPTVSNVRVSQNQDGVGEPRPAQFRGFQHGADTEEGAFVLQKPCHLNGTVAVGIRLDNAQQLTAGTELCHDLLCTAVDLAPLAVVEIVKIRVFQHQRQLRLLLQKFFRDAKNPLG